MKVAASFLLDCDRFFFSFKKWYPWVTSGDMSFHCASRELIEGDVIPLVLTIVRNCKKIKLISSWGVSIRVSTSLSSTFQFGLVYCILNTYYTLIHPGYNLHPPTTNIPPSSLTIPHLSINGDYRHFQNRHFHYPSPPSSSSSSSSSWLPFVLSSSSWGR